MWEVGWGRNRGPIMIGIDVQSPTSHIPHPTSHISYHHLSSRAGNGTRTRDPNLGKVVLYQLSYSRTCDQYSKSTAPGQPRERA
jgi:hypothetical protein